MGSTGPAEYLAQWRLSIAQARRVLGSEPQHPWRDAATAATT